MIALNSRDWVCGFQKISCFNNQSLAIGFTQKNQLECIGKAAMMLYLG